MENNNINEEFSQELSDLKWQFENMQQIFSNLENTISQAKKSPNYEEDSQDNMEGDGDVFSNQFGKESNSKDDKGKEDKQKQGGSKENNSKPEKQGSQNGMKTNSENKSDNGTSKLSAQIQNFMKETQAQQSNGQQEIQKSIQQAMDILNQANIQIQTNQALIRMNQFINQAEQQINHITKNNKSGENQKNTQNHDQKQSQISDPGQLN